MPLGERKRQRRTSGHWRPLVVRRQLTSCKRCRLCCVARAARKKKRVNSSAIFGSQSAGIEPAGQTDLAEQKVVAQAHSQSVSQSASQLVSQQAGRSACRLQGRVRVGQVAARAPNSARARNSPLGRASALTGRLASLVGALSSASRVSCALDLAQRAPDRWDARRRRCLRQTPIGGHSIGRLFKQQVYERRRRRGRRLSSRLRLCVWVLIDQLPLGLSLVGALVATSGRLLASRAKQS